MLDEGAERAGAELKFRCGAERAKNDPETPLRLPRGIAESAERGRGGNGVNDDDGSFDCSVKTTTENTAEDEMRG